MRPKINVGQIFVRILVQLIFPLAGLAILISVLPQWEVREHWGILFAYAGLTIVCSFAPVITFNTKLTLNNAVILSGILLYGTWVGVWSAFIETMILAVLFRSALERVLFNVGQILLTVWLVSGVNQLFMNLGVPWMVSDMLLIGIYLLANPTLAAIGIHHFMKYPFFEVLVGMLKSSAFLYLLLMAIGDIGARLIQYTGVWAIIPLVVTFFLIRTVFRQYHQSLDEIEGKVEEVKQLNNSFLIAMAASIDARDPYTHGHSYRVAYFGREIAKAIGLPKQQVDEVYFGGILHDIGKIGIEDGILNKNGKLTEEEYAKIKQHPVIGYQILLQAGVFPELLPAIRWHHERMDGLGYPDGLTGEQIPLMARILAISDAFDAMVSDRPYRKGMPVEVALERIEKALGTQFDTELASQFIKLVRETPEDELQTIIQTTGHEAIMKEG